MKKKSHKNFGEMGPKTKEAIMNFQKENNIVADGIIGNQTKKAMQLAYIGKANKNLTILKDYFAKSNSDLIIGFEKDEIDFSDTIEDITKTDYSKQKGLNKLLYTEDKR